MLLDDDVDDGADDKIFRVCCVVNRLLVDSIKPGEGDSLEEISHLKRIFIRIGDLRRIGWSE